MNIIKSPQGAELIIESNDAEPAQTHKHKLLLSVLGLATASLVTVGLLGGDKAHSEINPSTTTIESTTTTVEVGEPPLPPTTTETTLVAVGEPPLPPHATLPPTL